MISPLLFKLVLDLVMLQTCVILEFMRFSEGLDYKYSHITTPLLQAVRDFATETEIKSTLQRQK